VKRIAWFRSDLRIDDNGTLCAAAAGDADVLGLFLVADATWRQHDWGARRQTFVWQHVLALRESLARLGIPLQVLHVPLFADAARTVADFATAQGAGDVVAAAEYGVDEIARDAATANALHERGIGWQCLHDFTLLAPGTVRTREGAPFRVFSPFKRAWLEQVRGEPIDCQPPPSPRAPIDPPPLPDWQAPEATLDESCWPVGEGAAHARLRQFVEGPIHRYHEDRDIPSLDGTSRLSPYLACGVLSVRRCLEAALAANDGEWDSGSRGVQVWLSELIWREFYTHVLQAFPRVSRHRAFLPETERVPWRDAPEEFACWREGRTGFPLVDAGMRQLAATGWMHNRVRMVVATFLSKHLLMDWRAGERHFMAELVDGDLAANNGGWQWSASTGTDAAPYFRILSPERQAERFDPTGEYVRRWLPELAGCPAKALLKPGHPALLACGYPAPMLDTRMARDRVLQAFRAVGADPAGESA
jgi:deoxyribodipyrimidine photo-lyase